ncbi:MAG: DUF6913 domain-containing protein [Bacteroidales bacterium]
MPLPGVLFKKLAIRSIHKESIRHQRIPGVINLSDVKKAGILAEINNPGQLDLVRDLIHRLRANGILPRVIYFFNEKKIPSHFTPTGIEEGFSRKELGWSWLLPDLLTAGFTAESFDLLIDLSSESAFPLKMLAAKSKAGFKAGLMTPNFQSIYDLMISCQESCDLKQIIEQMLHYLEMINHKS